MPEQRKIKLITFDLDNTLWAVDPVIEAAENALYNWLSEHHHEITKHFSASALMQIRKDIVLKQPLMLHRLTALRKKTLETAFLTAGYSNKKALKAAQQAFNVFYQARNQVEFFPEVLNTLNTLSKIYQLATLSNGNACIIQTGLDAYISFHFSAEKVGQAKPHPALFEAAMQAAQARPQQCIHIGDHPEQDIIAANNLGLATIWVNMFAMSWPYDDKPGIEITHFNQLLQAISAIEKNF